MLKKMLSIVLCVVLVVGLMSCGGSSASGGVGDTSKTSSKSKLKGDFAFYMKEDGYTYYTNCENIGETLLYKGKVEKIWIDEKHNNIIFVADDLYYKPIKDSNSQLVTIDDANNIQIVNNKYIVYVCNSNLFVYDLDTKKKERISEQIDRYPGIEYKIFDDSKISWVQKYDSYEEAGETQKLICFGTYDLKTKKKNVVKLNDEERYFKYVANAEKPGAISKEFGFNGNTLYYVDYNFDNLESSVAILYEVKSDGKVKKIDELTGAIMYNVPTTSGGNSSYVQQRNIYLAIRILSTGEKGVIYQKEEGWKGTFQSNGWPDRISKYYYYNSNDGTTTELNEKRSISSSRFEIWYLSQNSNPMCYYSNNEYVKPNLVEPIADNEDYKGSNDSFFVGNNEYNGSVIAVSTDGKQIAYSQNDNLYLMNLSDGNVVELNSRLGKYDGEKIVFFNNNDILYNNNDLMLNQDVIFYNVNNVFADYVEFNNNLSCISLNYRGNAKLYKNGENYDIASNVVYSHLTNNGNAYYVIDGNLYLFKDGETTQILSGVGTSGENYAVPVYTTLR